MRNEHFSLEAHVTVGQGAVFYVVDPRFVITVDHLELWKDKELHY